MAQDTDEVIFRMTISTVFCLANLLLSKRGYTQTVLDDLRKSLFLFYVLQLDSGARKLCHDVEIFFTPDYIDSDVMFQKNINDVKRLVEVGWCLIKLCGCWVLKADRLPTMG